MPTKRTDLPVSAERLAELRERAKVVQAQLAHKPGYEELVDPADRENATPFYFALRRFVGQLRKAREAAGLSAAEVARRTGLAAETISRLETGAFTNPTYQTLARYAAAVGVRLVLTAEKGEAVT